MKIKMRNLTIPPKPGAVLGCVMGVLALLAVFFPSTASAVDWNPDLPYWMAAYPDWTKLENLTIPGSHESGANYEDFSSTAKCQDKGIGDQLNMGVRFLDIRLRNYNGSLVVHHGSVYQHQNFDDVLWQCVNFLQNHPTECIILSVKEEYSATGSDFPNKMGNYLNNPNYYNYWWRGDGNSPWCKDYIPTLGEVRGKIILARRYSSYSGWGGTGGIDLNNWGDNWEGYVWKGAWTPNGYKDIYVQDWYKVDNDTRNHKNDAIESQLDAQVWNPDNNCWVLNFTSGVCSVGGWPDIQKVSNDVGPWLSWRFHNPQRMGVRFGTIIMDFVNQDTIWYMLHDTGVNGGRHIFQNRANGKCIDGMGRWWNGANLAQWDLSWNANQQWDVEFCGNPPFFKLRNVGCGNYIDTVGYSANGTTVGLWGGSGSWNQQWYFFATDSGYFRIVSIANGKAIDNMGDNNNGTELRNWDLGWSWNQQFRVY